MAPNKTQSSRANGGINMRRTYSRIKKHTRETTRPSAAVIISHAPWCKSSTTSKGGDWPGGTYGPMARGREQEPPQITESRQVLFSWLSCGGMDKRYCGVMWNVYMSCADQHRHRSDCERLSDPGAMWMTGRKSIWRKGVDLRPRRLYALYKGRSRRYAGVKARR